MFLISRYNLAQSDGLQNTSTASLERGKTPHLQISICASKDIEWAIELLYNSVKTGSQLVWRPVWRPDPLVTRCGRENQHTEKNEKDTTLMAIRVEVNMLQFCSVSNSLSHTTLSIK